MFFINKTLISNPNLMLNVSLKNTDILKERNELLKHLSTFCIVSLEKFIKKFSCKLGICIDYLISLPYGSEHFQEKRAYIYMNFSGDFPLFIALFYVILTHQPCGRCDTLVPRYSQTYQIFKCKPL